MTFTIVALVLSCTFLIHTVMTYPPVPENAKEPWIYFANGLAVHIGGLATSAVSKVTGWPEIETARKVDALPNAIVYPNYPELEVEDLNFDGVPVRMYTPKKLKGLNLSPCVIYLHGGGWIVYDIDTHDSVTTPLALYTDMIVVSIDFRSAPENPYPAPLYDCANATKYVLQNGHRHGIDVNRVAIMGDSSGATLATAVTIRLADEEGSSVPALKQQVLLYPITQILNFRTSSMCLYRNDSILSLRLLSKFILAYFQLEWTDKNFQALETNRHISAEVKRPMYSEYFNEEFLPDYARQNPTKGPMDMDPFGDDVDEELARILDSLAVDPYVSPLVAENLSDLPPTYMVVTEFDILRDECFLYADRLKKAGVKVELSYAEGLPHGFMAPINPVIGSNAGQTEWDKVYTYLKDNL